MSIYAILAIIYAGLIGWFGWTVYTAPLMDFTE